jgi:membrane-bound lytic murein transglycosylase B
MTWTRSPLAVLLGLSLLAPAPSLASTGEGHQKGGSWGYLIDKLIADGIDRDQAAGVFRDHRVPPFDGLGFSLEPRESPSLYRQLRTSDAAAGVRRCIDRYWDEFRKAEERLGVAAGVLGAILYTETRCGSFTGNHVVLHRLARLAMASEPANLTRNIQRHTRGAKHEEARRIEGRVRERARQLEDLFYPEVLATFRLAERLGIDPLAIRGSPSGAFGLPQFLPTSFLRYAIDGNGDGKVSLYDPADAIASAANYLVSHGWRHDLSRDEQRRVIWAYNRSDAYVDAILFLADRVP